MGCSKAIRQTEPAPPPPPRESPATAHYRSKPTIYFAMCLCICPDSDGHRAPNCANTSKRHVSVLAITHLAAIEAD